MQKKLNSLIWLVRTTVAVAQLKQQKLKGDITCQHIDSMVIC